MPGKLNQNPAAELIREISESRLTGALRLARARAKVVVYFGDGELLFATSNLRAHRLREILQQRGFTNVQLGRIPNQASDDELAVTLLQRGDLTAQTLAAIRTDQVADMLRLALLWTDGSWEFDVRARPAVEARVRIEVKQILFECARHLPSDFVTSRLFDKNGTYLPAANHESATTLLPEEAFVLSRASGGVTLGELTALSGLQEAEALRTIYSLSLSGQLHRSDWPQALSNESSRMLRTQGQKAADHPASSRTTMTTTVEDVDPGNVDVLFKRLADASDYYEVLGVSQTATSNEIKAAYHTLALTFHPDRFHKSEAALRRNIDSAFARIAQAYETLSNQSARTGYDQKQQPKGRASMRQAASPAQPANGERDKKSKSEAARAETSFQRGMEAIKSSRHNEAVPLLAEAAMLAPREARYRAHYGHALIKQANTRRMAEGELQAALTLDPENPSYRVMLAELYQELGLRRRAEGELQRALAADPKNQSARELLLSLKSK
ncbi:MAG: DnaJ domain-containing protein [Acidobacteriota bacterium]